MPKEKKRKKTPAYKQVRNKNRLGMTMAVIAFAMVYCAVKINSNSLMEKQAKLIARENELQIQLEAQEERARQLEEYETYSKTKKFAEEIAKEKLGLVYENQIIFKEEN